MFRVANSGCSASNPVQRDWQSGYRRSLRYRIETVQISEWTEGGMECGNSFRRYSGTLCSHYPYKIQWHDVRTLPIIALKVLREVWRELLQKFPPSHPLASPRIPRIPLPLFDGEAERAETATESEVVAMRVGKEVGALQTELAVAVE